MHEPPDPADYIAVESAGKAAGISPRTLRHWVATGKLSAIAGKRGNLVSLREVRRLAALTGKVAGNAEPPPEYPATSAAGVAGNLAESLADEPAALAPSDAARANLALVRDEWLAPLVAELRELERENGRLGAERDAARTEVATLRARLAAQDRSHAEEAPSPVPGDLAPARGIWARLVRRWGRRVG